MTARKISLLIVALIAFAFAGCGGSGGDRMGYIVCDADDDCAGQGVCIAGESFKYCGVECTIDNDCLPDGDAEGDAGRVCHENRCVEKASLEGEDAAAEP
ncbi:MAG: hypothetical protein C4523_19875 [Myxococcales bacterium]|nr:MAG: hypothetical protein C4523_19875 [Myxococcales bacterium]